MNKLHIKKGDTVIVLAGDRKDKGKSGKVLKVLVDENRAIVEGRNLVSKIARSLQQKILKEELLSKKLLSISLI